MIKRIFILASVPALLFFSGCSQKRSEAAIDGNYTQAVEINGILEDGAGKMVMLEEMGAREYETLDTTICDEKGFFHIHYTTDQMAFYVLRYGESGYITLRWSQGNWLNSQVVT